MLNLEVQNLSYLTCNGCSAILIVMVSRAVVPLGWCSFLGLLIVGWDDKILCMLLAGQRCSTHNL